MMDNGEYRVYSIVVQTFKGESVAVESMTIFATGLQGLLELRRIHQLLINDDRFKSEVIKDN